MEYAARGGACSDTDDNFRIGNLLVQILQDPGCAPVNGPRNEKYVSMLRVSHIDHTESFHVIKRSQTGEYLYVTAITGTVVKVQNPWRFNARSLYQSHSS